MEKSKKEVEDTKKVEVVQKPKNKSNIGIIIFLVIIILGLFAYIGYNKGVFDGLLSNKPSAPESKEEKVEYDFKVVDTDIEEDSYNGMYLIGKFNNNWIELDHQNSKLNIIGTKDNKLYYSDYKHIKYIDLTDDTHKVNTIYNSNGDTCRGNINDPAIYGDKIYFELAISCHDSKLVSIEISDTALNEPKEVLGDVNDYVVVGDEIYYNVGFHCNDHKFYKYNMNTKKNTLIGTGICSFEIKDNNLIYFKNNNYYDEKVDKFVYSNNSGYYNYDMNTGKSTKIDTVNISFNNDNSMNVLGIIYDGSVYYIDGLKLMKNTNGVNETIYTYNKSDSDSKYRLSLDDLSNGKVFVIRWEEYRELSEAEIEDSDITEHVLSDGVLIISDGKAYTEKTARSVLESYNVTMADGSTRNFSILDTISY